MRYVCNKCNNVIVLDEDTTLDDLFVKRVLLNKDGYWHWTCARIGRSDSGFYVEDGSKGKLVAE